MVDNVDFITWIHQDMVGVSLLSQLPQCGESALYLHGFIMDYSVGAGASTPFAIPLSASMANAGSDVLDNVIAALWTARRSWNW